MKISEIQIQQFGVWKNLTLPIKNSGLNVIYGPNEAGKSTLLRFVRSLLYGYTNPAGKSADITSDCDGSLAVLAAGKKIRIRRTSKHGTRGLVSITGKNEPLSDDQVLTELLAGTDEAIFENIFAIGLHELQELATLDHNSVSQKLYSLTLGSKGKTLLGVSQLLEHERQRFVSNGSPHGSEHASLLQQVAELTKRIGEADQRFADAGSLRQKTRGLEQAIRQLTQRQNEINSEERHLAFMNQVWKPWIRVREIESQLSDNADFASFPADGFERFKENERELKTLIGQRGDFRKQMDGFRSQWKSNPNRSAIGRNASAIASFVEQREWLKEIIDNVRTLDRDSTTAKQAVDKTLASMPKGWSIQRLESVDTSPKAHFQILELARGYQSALSIRRRFRRRYDRLSNRCRQQTGKLKEQAQTFGGRSVDDALAQTSQQLAHLVRLEQLNSREKELREKLNRLKQQVHLGEGNWGIPLWMVAMLWLFGLAGIGFVIAGIYAGVTDGWIAGGAYALLAATCGVLNWAMGTHYERAGQTFVEELYNEVQTAEIELRKTEESADRLVTKELTDYSQSLIRIEDSRQAEIIRLPNKADGLASRYEIDQKWSGITPRIWDVESFATVRKHLESRKSDLDEFVALHKTLQTNRQRLSRWRKQMQALQNRVSVRRQSWCDFLRKLGLAETVRVNEAFDIWQKVVEANDQRRNWKIKSNELQSQQRIVHAFCQRIEKLGTRISNWDFDYTKPLDVLTAWNEELQAFRRQRQEIAGSKKQYSLFRKNERSLSPKIRQLKKQQSSLMLQANVDDKEQFLKRMSKFQQTQELRNRLEEARRELDAVATQHAGLAIVEEDLFSFSPAKHEEKIELLGLEKDENQTELEKLHQQLGSAKQGASEIENNHQTTLLRFERQRLKDQIQDIEEKWCAVQLADQSLQTIRSRFERDSQPETLLLASKYLNKLTAGAYKQVWTRLDQHRLLVEDERGQNRSVKELSNGTREQLFLAIRLALVDEFRQQGI